MKKLLTAIGAFGLILLISIGCAPLESPTPMLQPTPKISSAMTTKPAWQEEWEKTIAAAKQEGKVNESTTLAPHVRDSLSTAFKEKYGIEREVLAAGNAVEILAKLDAERRAGLYTTDVILTGAASMAPSVAEPMEPLLILPEVRDVNAWRDKRLPFYDKEGKIFMFLARVGPTILINKELVKPEEITSWQNLLEPKWRGKISIWDPSITGPGDILLTAVGEIMGIGFLKQLAEQEPAINRDKRLQVEWVLRGKYLVGIGFHFDLMEEMRGAGAPLAHVVPKEGTYFGSATGGITVIDRRPHPNATKVFINWFLSREGQTLYARVAKEQSRRVDVAPELAPDRLIAEGIKYIDMDNDYMDKKRREMLTLSREIFARQYR